MAFIPSKQQHGSDCVSRAAFVLYIKPQEELIRGAERSLTVSLYDGHPGSKSLRDQLLNDNATLDNDTC